MSGVIQVNFDPTIWNAPGLTPPGFGTSGQDAFSVWLDNDGTTCWAFEYFASGFARFHLSDGSIIKQDNLFGVSPTFAVNLSEREDGTVLFAQDNSSHYFLMTSNTSTTDPHVLYKFHIGSGTPGTLLNGYEIIDGSLDLSTATPAVNTDALEDMRWFNYGGTNYVAICGTGFSHLWVFNADTMAFVGSFGGGSNEYWKVFADSSNNLWSLVTNGGNTYLMMWNPTLGVTGTTLNAAIHNITSAISFQPTFATYVPANNSVFLGNSVSWTGNTAVVSLTTFTQSAFHADDLTFFYNGTFDAPESAMDLGVQSGVLAIPGDTNNDTQVGGILNIIDPTTLTLSSTFNVSAAINASLAVTTPIPTESQYMRGTSLVPFSNMQYSAATNKVVVAYEYIGSPVYIVDLTPAPPPTPPTYEVEGYLLTSQVDAKSALQNLMAAYFLDVVESDFKLYFIPRGFNSSVLTIPEDDLGIGDDKAKLIETQTMPQELPRFVSVNYIDPTLDWQQNNQIKNRNSRVVKTKQALSLSLPMVLDATEARQIAEKALYLAWLERKPWQFNLFRPSYMVIDPADIISFVYENTTYTMRVVGNTIGVNYGMQIQGVSEDPNNYSAVSVGGTDPAITTQTSNPLFPTILLLRDIPYLEDSDAVADRSTTGYYFAMTAADSRWVGGVLYKSADDTNFDAVDSSTDRVWYGNLNNTLGDPPILYTWDDVNTIDITMVDGKNWTLSSTTDLNVLNGANVLIVGDEVVQYANAVQTSPGRYTLSRLLRGRRNTEYAAYGHSANEIGFDPTTGIKRETAPLSLIDLLRYYRGVTVGQDITTVGDTDLTIAANDLKPASPTDINGVRDMSGNLTINWIRRTRYAGDWLNNTGSVPLNEDSEAYSIDIYSAGFGSVLRTITWVSGTYDGNGNPTAPYSATDQTTDFGSPQSSIDIKVYQISAQVGRGQEGDATV